MNEPLAKIYGLQGVTGEAFQRVAVNASQRGGVLTHGSFLSSTSGPTRPNIVVRGTWILNEMLCTPLPPPPVDALASVKIPDNLPANTTTRQRFEIHSTDPVCAGCHREIDPLGFAFDHYDAAGLWRDTENGLPIDATGEIFKTDAKGKFNGALELSERLSQSRDVQNCFVGKWMAFAYGRQETPDDACTRQLLQNAFAKSKGNVIELIVALTQTDAFLYRSDKE